jgi:hypothetical protein
MESYTFVTNDYARRRHTDQLQVSTNNISSSVNTLNQRVAEIKDVVGTTVGLIKEEKDVAKRRDEELKEGLGQAFVSVEKQISYG